MRRAGRRGALVGLAAGALVVAAGVMPANAVTQTTGPAPCGNQEVVVASSTVGNTLHLISAGLVWDKGYRNGGATTYSGYSSLRWVATDAPTINSSGFRCA